MGGGGGGEIADSHNRIAAVAKEPAHVTLVHPDIEHMTITHLTAADPRILRTAGETLYDITHKILNSGDRLHEMGRGKENPVPQRRDRVNFGEGSGLRLSEAGLSDDAGHSLTGFGTLADPGVHFREVNQ